MSVPVIKSLVSVRTAAFHEPGLFSEGFKTRLRMRQAVKVNLQPFQGYILALKDPI